MSLRASTKLASPALAIAAAQLLSAADAALPPPADRFTPPSAASLGANQNDPRFEAYTNGVTKLVTTAAALPPGFLPRRLAPASLAPVVDSLNTLIADSSRRGDEKALVGAYLTASAAISDLRREADGAAMNAHAVREEIRDQRIPPLLPASAHARSAQAAALKALDSGTPEDFSLKHREFLNQDRLVTTQAMGGFLTLIGGALVLVRGAGDSSEGYLGFKGLRNAWAKASAALDEARQGRVDMPQSLEFLRAKLDEVHSAGFLPRLKRAVDVLAAATILHPSSDKISDTFWELKKLVNGLSIGACACASGVLLVTLPFPYSSVASFAPFIGAVAVVWGGVLGGGRRAVNRLCREAREAARGRTATTVEGASAAS